MCIYIYIYIYIFFDKFLGLIYFDFHLNVGKHEGIKQTVVCHLDVPYAQGHRNNVNYTIILTSVNNVYIQSLDVIKTIIVW